ncbi:rhodanese-like domain-containing protein [Massilia eburnea]|uniref:rhodanese-like domain-containing protein n=1 Tax=Massilia eburnea TaxID=1776165 RepID=UPI003D6BD428
MKYPEILPIEDVLARLDDFDTIIDARSPSEYALDHLPNAINCPVLDDQQRITVGTMYKQVGAFEAKKVGAAMVSKNIGYHIETLWLDKPREWKPLIYCWRGGNRSGSMATVLAKIGWPVVQLDGGYKAFRGAINTQLEQTPELDFRVICGTTGSGQNPFARYAGSDRRPGAGPGTVGGASRLGAGQYPLPAAAFAEKPSRPLSGTVCAATIRACRCLSKPRVARLGACACRDALMERMRAFAVHLDAGSARRPRQAADRGLPAFRLQRPCPECTARVPGVQLHGRERIERWQSMANAGEMPALVDELLVDHYDPAYLKSIHRNFVQFDKATELALPRYFA